MSGPISENAFWSISRKLVQVVDAPDCKWMLVATQIMRMPGGTFVIVTVCPGTLGISQACQSKHETYDHVVELNDNTDTLRELNSTYI